MKLGALYLFDLPLIAVNVALYIWGGQHWWSILAAGLIAGMLLAVTLDELQQRNR